MIPSPPGSWRWSQVDWSRRAELSGLTRPGGTREPEPRRHSGLCRLRLGAHRLRGPRRGRCLGCSPRQPARKAGGVHRVNRRAKREARCVRSALMRWPARSSPSGPRPPTAASLGGPAASGRASTFGLPTAAERRPHSTVRCRMQRPLGESESRSSDRDSESRSSESRSSDLASPRTPLFKFAPTGDSDASSRSPVTRIITGDSDAPQAVCAARASATAWGGLRPRQRESSEWRAYYSPSSLFSTPASNLAPRSTSALWAAY